MAKNDLCTVRRPVKGFDAIVVLCHAVRFTLAGFVLLNRDRVETGHLDILVHPAKVIFTLIVLFLVIRFSIGHCIGDPTAVGRPFKIRNAGFAVGQGLGLAAAYSKQIDIVLVVLAGRCKSDPFAVGRPFRICR